MPTTDLPDLPDGLFYGQVGRMLHVWRHAPTARQPQRWESVCGMSEQREAPPTFAAGEQLVRCYGCRDTRKLAARAAAETPVAVAGDKALVPAAEAVEGILVMSQEEAAAAEAAIIKAAANLRQLIDDFDRRRGWMALGYESFRAWALVKFPETSLPTIYRQRDAAAVDRDLGVAIGNTPESHARELKHVPPAERLAVMRQADERAATAGRERTAADVREVARSTTTDAVSDDEPITGGTSMPPVSPETLVIHLRDLEARILEHTTRPNDPALLGELRRQLPALSSLVPNRTAASVAARLDAAEQGLTATPCRWSYGHNAAGAAVAAIDPGPLSPSIAGGIATAAAALRSLILGEPVDSTALDELVERLRDEGEGATTLIAVIEEIASDADVLAEPERGTR